jgi:signal transduction histidine kinase
LASVAANYTDHLLHNNLARLYDVSLSGVVDLEDGDWEPERRALKTAFEYSVFSAGLFLLNADAEIVLSYPHAQVTQLDLEGIPDVQKAFNESKPFLSRVHTLSQTGRRAMFAFAPLRDKLGRTVGVIGGEIDPTTHFLRNSVHSIPDSLDTVIELLDDQGIVIASSNPERVFACSDRSNVLGNLIATRQKAVLQCHRCHESGGNSGSDRSTDILAFAPLQAAPWGVAVREPESAVYAPSDYLRWHFAILGVLVIGSALGLGFAISRSIVSPIQDLTKAASRIAGGELSQPVEIHSSGEIGILGESFESMRIKLAKSLETLTDSNLELERRVEYRTRELDTSRSRLAFLLDKVMTAQEEERRRIARELHDETLQATAALGLALEIAAISLDKESLTSEELHRLKETVDQLIDGMNAIIQDLRPPMLDDLGLNAALRWFLDHRLAGKNIPYHLLLSDGFRRAMDAMPETEQKKLELSLFRIIQEAVNNAAKHSRASQITVTLTGDFEEVRILVQDNGTGFDIEKFFQKARTERKGYGIVGIRERAALLGGRLDLNSAQGEGTTLTVRLPITQEAQNGSNPSSDSG